MTSFASLPIDKLLGPGFDCDCGHHHSAPLKIFKSGAGTIRLLPDVVRQLGAKKPFVVCDKNTFKAAGEQATTLLKQAGIDCALLVLPWDEIEPDERTMGAISMNFDPGCDLMLAVGSGVINDCCKQFAHVCSLPSMVVGTAPSMDGYASSSSAMLVFGVKTTLYNGSPDAIILDSDILCQAPMRMLWAGLGDMLAKYISVCEWRLSNLITGEYMCPEVAQLMRNSLSKVVENAELLAQRDPQAALAVCEGLVMSGIAMSFAGTSRPASGLEHYFSHLWEMMALERSEKSDLHGIQVGVGTLIALKLYDWIRTIAPDKARGEAFMRQFDPATWEKEVRRIFGGAADQVIAIEKREHKNDPAQHALRLQRAVDHWDEVLKIIGEELPPTERIASLMQKLGMPMTNTDIGISPEDTMDAYTGAREIRNKYLSCSMLWDLGMADEARAKIGEIAR